MAVEREHALAIAGLLSTDITGEHNMKPIFLVTPNYLLESVRDSNLNLHLLQIHILTNLLRTETRYHGDVERWKSQSNAIIFPVACAPFAEREDLLYANVRKVFVRIWEADGKIVHIFCATKNNLRSRCLFRWVSPFCRFARIRLNVL